MPDFPIFQDGSWAKTEGVAATTSRAIVSSAPGAANTKSTYTELVASTSRPATGLVVNICGPSNNSIWFLVDIAIGAAGSEKVIAANLALPVARAALATYFLPLSIPAGSRISFRIQATLVATIDVQVVLIHGGLQQQVYQQLIAYGIDTTTSAGTLIDGGAAANTKGAYVQLVASTSRPHSGLFVMASQGYIAAFASDLNHLIDIAIGAAASEKVILADYAIRGYQYGTEITASALWLPIKVPAGSRIAARMQSNSIDAEDRTTKVSAYGIS